MSSMALTLISICLRMRSIVLGLDIKFHPNQVSYGVVEGPYLCKLSTQRFGDGADLCLKIVSMVRELIQLNEISKFRSLVTLNLVNVVWQQVGYFVPSFE